MKKFQYAQLLLLSFFLSPLSVQAQEFKGELAWSELRVINPPVRGVVERVHVKPGDRVKKGELLIDVSDVIYRSRVNEMKARVARLEPEMFDARLSLSHAEGLYERTVLSEVELERAHHAYDRAKGFVDEATAKLNAAKWDLSNCQMRANADVLVVSVDVLPGHVITLQENYAPLIRVASADKMRVRVLMTDKEIQHIKKHQKASVVVLDKNYDGEVVEIGVEPDKALSIDVLFALFIEFKHDGQTNLGADLRAGQKVSLTFP